MSPYLCLSSLTGFRIHGRSHTFAVSCLVCQGARCMPRPHMCNQYECEQSHPRPWRCHFCPSSAVSFRVGCLASACIQALIQSPLLDLQSFSVEDNKRALRYKSIPEGITSNRPDISGCYEHYSNLSHCESCCNCMHSSPKRTIIARLGHPSTTMAAMATRFRHHSTGCRMSLCLLTHD